MNKFKKNKNFFHKKTIITAILFLFVFSLITPIILIPHPAQAIADPTSGIIVTTFDKIWGFISKQYKKVNAFLYKKGLGVYLNSLAQDAAVYLTSGNSGQKKLFLENRKKYYKEVADGVAGDFLNNLAKGKMGGICNSTKGGEPFFRAPSQSDPTKDESLIRCKSNIECPDVKLTEGACVHNYKDYKDQGKKCKSNKDCVVEIVYIGSITSNLDGEDYEWEKQAFIGNAKDMGIDEFDVDIDNTGKVSSKVKGECQGTMKGKCWIPGFDLCETDLKLRANIIGTAKDITASEGLNESKCPISKMSEHYKEIKNRTKIEDWIDYQKHFEPGANDIGIQLSLMTILYDKKQDAVVEEEKNITDGTLSLKNTISKTIKTPASKINDWWRNMISKDSKVEETRTENPIADAFSIFGKTLAGRLIKQVFVDGLIPPSPGNNPSMTGSTGSSMSIKEAQKIYSSIFTPKIISGGNYDILTNYLSCPEDLNFSQMDNCVLNDEWGTLLQNNERITFKDAIDKSDKYSWINLPVGKNRSGAIFSKGEQNEGFSLDNIKKMRKARIVPLGLELAAEKIINSSDIESKSLKEVVDGFNVIGSPFYHLVDPNWIIKIPQHQCGAKVFGSILESAESTQRGQVCADLKSCLKEDAEGNCQGAWGYCVREKNIWRFNGDQCSERFNTCQTFQKENQNVSYLKNTLDYNGCDSSNSGCLWYSKTKQNSDRIYFNKNVQACAVQNSGCHEFIQLSNIEDNLTNAEVLEKVQNDEERDDDYSNYAIVNKIYLNKNRIQCNELNAGCEKYTSTNGEPWIPGIVKTIENLCPQKCVGYKNYHQLATNFEPSQQNVYLIPNGKQCSVSEAGCDEFTNLNEVAKGGESKEYYTYLRRCVKANESGCGIFYTWVGSDTQGFQLKAYNLQKAEDGSGSPKTTNVSLNLGDCSSEADALNNPECKEFFDELGKVYYKIYKNTITCSDDCQPLRKSNVATEVDCTRYNGIWETNKCIFMVIPKEGMTCSATSNGCRAYRGNHGDNVRIILQDNFEDQDFHGWDNATITSTASVTGGSSIKAIANNLIQSSSEIIPSLLIQNKSYEISFWAKSGRIAVPVIAENVEVRFNNDNENGILSFGTQSIGTEWNKYTLGPLLFNRAVSEIEKLEIVGNAYIDNISLKEITNDIYLIKNSWNVPASCDQTLNREPLPQAMLNCGEYQDRRGGFHYLKSFSSICAENLIGCQTLIDTQNSILPYEQEINGINIPADLLAYYVNNPQNYCAAQEKGCEFFGLPELEVNGSVKKDKNGKEIWKDVYLKNNPDQYATTICSADGMSCQEYKYDNGNAIAYFKDPKDKVCEYKMVVGQENYGWYKKGTESGLPDCETDGKILEGWVGSCSDNYSGCTQFKDYLGTQSFYYLNNDKIDRNSPNGLVSEKEGKILFNDTSKKELIYDAEATYKESEDQNKAVSPVSDCNSPALACYRSDGNFKNPLPTNCIEKIKNNTTPRKECTANSIIKVDRDRVCGQWLSCKNSIEIFSEGRKKNICNENGLCREFAGGVSSGCERWVTAKQGEKCSDDLDCLSGKCANITKLCQKTMPLDEANYKNRDISWEGLDYSGYAIANQYPIFALKQLDYSRNSSNPIWKLGYKPEEINPISKSCRAYPEASSPFPKTISKQQGFQNANVCSQQEIADDACECSYKKIETMNYTTAYLNTSTAVPTGICSDGVKEKIGMSCSSNDDCCNVDVQCIIDNKGQCSTTKKANEYLGWKGYCLEEDKSTLINKEENKGACLTWYPVDIVSGEIDSSLNFPDAGFNPATTLGFSKGGPYYCLEKTGAFQWMSTYGRGYWKVKGWIMAVAVYLNPTILIKTSGIGAIIESIKSSDECPPFYNRTNVESKTKPWWFQRLFTWKCKPYQGDGCYDKNTKQRIDSLSDNEDNCNNGKMCDIIANVSDESGNNKAWTDRIWQAQKTSDSKNDYNKYSYNAQCNIFGALSNTTKPEKLPIYLTPKTCGVAQLKEKTTKEVIDTGWLSVNDYANNKDDLKNIFAKSMGFYSWGFNKKRIPVNICDDNSYNKGTPCNNAETKEKDNSLCQIIGECKAVAYTCSNKLGKIITETDGAQYNSGECNPNAECKGNSACSNGICDDENITCSSGENCSSNNCQGKCDNDDNKICTNHGSSDCPAIAPSTEAGSCVDKKCISKSCNPAIDCKNTEGIQKCPEDGSYISGDQTIENCPKICTENTDETVKNCVNQTGTLVPVDDTNTTCTRTGICLKGIDQDEEIGCDSNSDCSDTNGTCIEFQQEISDPNTSLYSKIETNDQDWDVAETKKQSEPKIRAVSKDRCKIDQNWCPMEGTSNGFTVNNQTSGDIAGKIGLSVVVKFYAWADKNQMPLRQIIIDWGDKNETDTGTANKMKNHKEKCIIANGFGDTPQACTETYFQFSHVYLTKGEFSPKVSVKDNWEWCTDDYYAGDKKCSVKNTSGEDGFINYNGKIIIK